MDKQERGQGLGWMGWDAGFSLCEPLYVEWISNKGLLDSTEN